MDAIILFIGAKHLPIKLDRITKRRGIKPWPLLLVALSFFSAFFIPPFSLRAEVFDWRNILGYSFVTPVKNQGSSGMCSAFASVGALEAKYKITRNDPTFDIDLSEQQLAGAGIINWSGGGYIDAAFNYFESTGEVTESVCPWTGSSTSNWPPADGWQNSVCKMDSYTSGYWDLATIKSNLKQNGPMAMYMEADSDWYPNPGSDRGGHAVLMVGYVDDQSVAGGGYFIVKNSWGSGWNWSTNTDSGYGKLTYSTVVNNRQMFPITSGAYFNGATSTVNWDTSTASGYQAGGGTWSTSNSYWSSSGTSLSSWANGECAAVFSSGGGTYTINVGYDVSAHSITFNTGASGYTFTGGTLTVTTGGITCNESVTMNTGLTVGGNQTWTVASGNTLTVNANVNTHISALTINCAGDATIKGAIRDVRGDTRWNGLLSGYSGSLTKSGTGTLTLCGNNTYTGNTAITAGKVMLGATPAGLSEGRIDTYFDTVNSNPAASIQLGTRMANTNWTDAAKTYVYTGYINNSGSTSATWYFAENYDDAVCLYIDGVQVLYDTQWNVQTSGTYTLTPGLHSFELRLGGNGIPNGPNGTGVNGTGLGVAYSTNGGATYLALTDPGDGSLFRLSNTSGGSMSPASTVVMSSSTTLDLNNYSTTVGGLADATGTITGHRVLLGTASLTTGGNDSSNSFSGVISGTGALTKIGTGVQALTGSNTYSGGTFLNGGYLSVLSYANLGGTSIAALTFNGGGLQFRNSTFDPTTRSITINSGGASFDTNGYTVNFNNALSGTGGITKAGSGTLVYKAVNSYSGNTAITAGTLKTQITNAIPGGSGNGNVSISYGATLDLYGYAQTINGLSGLGTVDNTIANSIILNVGGNNANSTFDGKIQNTSGTMGISKIGSGTFTLTGINTYSGSTTISAGTLKLASPVTVANRWSFNNSLADSVGGSNAAIVDVGANNVTLGTTQATLTGGASTASDYIRLGTNLLPKTNVPVAIELWATPKSLQNWSRIFDFGADTSANLFMSWTQGTTQSTDRVEWKNNGTTSTSDNTNQPYNLNTEYHIVMVLTPLGDSTTEVKWYSATSASPNLGSARGSFVTTINLTNFTDSEDNLGRSFYSSDNTANASYNEVRIWSGPMNSNILEILHDAGADANLSSLNLGGALPSATAVNISGSGATLDLNNFGQTIGSLAGVTGSSVLLGSATLTLGGNGTSTTFSGIISGSGGLIKNGGGVFTLKGANTYAGTTTISYGAIKIGADNVLPSGAGKGNVAIASGATLDLGGFSQIINGLTGAGTVDNTASGNSVLTVGANDAGSTFSGIVKNTSGVMSLIKTGAGAIILSGANSYTGATSVAGGVLEAANASALGTTAAGTSVQSGASLRILQSLTIANESLSLSGTGAGSGALHVGPSAVVSYGGAINLADNASINVDAGSTLNLTNSLGISGSSKDLTFVTAAGANAVLSGSLDLGDGDLNKNGSGALIISGDILSVATATIADGSLQVNSLSASIDDITGSGDLIVGNGSTAATLTADSIVVDTLSIGAGSSSSGTVQSVPEPSSVLLLSLAAVTLLGLRFSLLKVSAIS
ncbi:MAG: autotransporter-associated beta strand repeat-containing protein [Thermoguttaceae bacterium]